MKKFTKVLTMIALLIAGGQAMAQTRGVMFFGASFPMQEFGKFERFDDFALANAQSKNCGAGTGFNVGLRWYFSLGKPGLSVMLSVDGLINGPCPDLKTAYNRGDGVMDGQFYGSSFVYNLTPKYINVPIMLGINYMYHFNPYFGVYVEAGGGGNLSFITDMEYTAKVDVGNYPAHTRVIDAFDEDFVFTYQIGVGLEVAKNLMVGCNFYDFGKSTARVKQIIHNDPTTPTVNTLGVVHPIMVLGRVGFTF